MHPHAFTIFLCCESFAQEESNLPDWTSRMAKRPIKRKTEAGAERLAGSERSSQLLITISLRFLAIRCQHGS